MKHSFVHSLLDLNSSIRSDAGPASHWFWTMCQWELQCWTPSSLLRPQQQVLALCCPHRQENQDMAPGCGRTGRSRSHDDSDTLSASATQIAPFYLKQGIFNVYSWVTHIDEWKAVFSLVTTQLWNGLLLAKNSLLRSGNCSAPFLALCGVYSRTENGIPSQKAGGS